MRLRFVLSFEAQRQELQGPGPSFADPNQGRATPRDLPACAVPRFAFFPAISEETVADFLTSCQTDYTLSSNPDRISTISDSMSEGRQGPNVSSTCLCTGVICRTVCLS